MEPVNCRPFINTTYPPFFGRLTKEQLAANVALSEALEHGHLLKHLNRVRKQEEAVKAQAFRKTKKEWTA